MKNKRSGPRIEFHRDQVKELHDAIDWEAVESEQVRLAEMLSKVEGTGSFCIAMVIAGLASLRAVMSHHDLIGLSLAIVSRFRLYPEDFHDVGEMVDFAEDRKRDLS
jgi:hypothetical protein